MKITIVICAYTMDRWSDLNSAVISCLHQTLEPDEVLIITDHNPELFDRATREIAGVRVLANQSTKGLSGARNTGVAYSTGDLIVFLDDDAHADRDWIERLTAPFRDRRTAGVGGWIVPDWETAKPTWLPESFYWTLGCSYEGLPASGTSIRNPIGANMAMRREVFDSVGGFTPGIGRIGSIPLGCEETELCIRYASRVPDDRFVLVRDAVVHHRVPASRTSLKYFLSRCWAEGLSKAAVASLVGAEFGLAAERMHVMRALPKEFFASIRAIRREPRDAFFRSMLIVLGVAVTAAGFARGSIAVRRSPLSPGGDELWSLMGRSDIDRED